MHPVQRVQSNSLSALKLGTSSRLLEQVGSAASKSHVKYCWLSPGVVPPSCRGNNFAVPTFLCE